MLVAPAIALAQATENTLTQGVPTANSAASQVGKVPPAALDKSGKRVEPSQKLWNNPRTEAEQPGTQPPSNGGNGDDARTPPGPKTEQASPYKGHKPPHMDHKPKQN
ncbi:hypothetical protein AA0473_2512 [Acetobacter orleanensis NRIC 0473]|uniref:Uncharacterized protein n=2 Tax=Acetobacter orleanensis TaxID=104099 RepID=A0A4Y3TIS0_9PROT|nr:hypothetical protein CO710_03395 [Acetobacter orleanensis]GBR31343.1 hypothetical protein AA0473_2512 [Acetobacter orleanensis NRIC 0473]GEB82881.1 hypothetical protein AOR01nite_13580 [Acetobacter orleanensis]